MLDRLGERVDHRDRHLHPQVLGVPVLGRRNANSHRSRVLAGPLIADQLDPGVGEPWIAAGRRALATFLWTSSVSAELQTPGRCTFAL